MTTLWIRTETSSEAGMGHFMRCFALAEAARSEGYTVTFCLNETTGSVSDAVQARLASIGADLQPMNTAIGTTADAAALMALIPARQGDLTDWLVFDSYHLTSETAAQVYDHTNLLIFDDLAAYTQLKAHIIVNAAPAALQLPYDDMAPQAVTLLGPRYAQIRAEFTTARTAMAGEGFIAVMFGGSDPQNLSAQVVEVLVEELFPAVGEIIPVRIIAGPANPHIEALTVAIDGHNHITLCVAPDSVADALNGARLVITAAGGSVNEIAAQGLMALMLIVADNQVIWLKSSPYPAVDARGGLPEDFGPWVAAFLNHEEICLDVVTQANRTIDGQGARRVMEVISRF